MPDAAHRPSVDRRLWSFLAAPGERREPLRGADVFGARASGFAARARARRLDPARVERILSLGAALRDHSAAAFASHVEGVRELAVLRHDDVDAVDRAFAAGFEAVRRATALSLHPVQVHAALAMSRGCCAELATGEGKTITAILPAALDAWQGRGVHVLTVNDYLAQRDAETTKEAYRLLDVRVGVLSDGMPPPERRAAYNADVTYAADKQVIFDYLRDRLVSPLAPRLAGLLLSELAPEAKEKDRWGERVVQRGLYSAIVDEADSILVDEAVTPAIISSAKGQAEAGGAEHFRLAAMLADRFEEGRDYTIDHVQRRVRLTPVGRAALATMAAHLPAFWAGPRRSEELLTTAIGARVLYMRGRDYLVRDGEVLIVDRSTGRALPGRQWQLGIHQAVEAKEGLPVSADSGPVARISYRGFIQRYRRVSGMTGTAAEVAHELWEAYQLPVVRVPTHKPVVREEPPDQVFHTRQEKLEALAVRVEQEHARERPVLVGAWDIATSEQIAAMLAARGIQASVLNASREADEAAIVARAGEAGAVTVATNMAGRGTDIRLSPEAREAGGLVVLATERHDERRVDRQLFGRAGRQGDPGVAQAYVSLEDRLILRHGPRVLVWLYRFMPPGAPSRLCASLLWRVAQHLASARWRTIRAEVAKADDWFEMAMHNVAR